MLRREARREAESNEGGAIHGGLHGLTSVQVGGHESTTCTFHNRTHTEQKDGAQKGYYRAPPRNKSDTDSESVRVSLLHGTMIDALNAGGLFRCVDSAATYGYR